MTRPHSHYHKDVSKLQSVDVYRVLQLFDVTDQALGHAVKKLLCAGKRGGKSFEQDVREAVDTLNRRLQMLAEDDAEPRLEAPWIMHNGKGLPQSYVGHKLFLRRHNGTESGPHEAKDGWTIPGNDFWWKDPGEFTVSAYRLA